MNLGWFEDIFKVSIQVDSDHLTRRHALLLQQECPLFDAKGKISGRVVITPPEGSAVWQWGISMNLDGVVTFFESLNSSSISSHEIPIAKEGYISDEKEYPFEIDLAALSPEGGGFLDSYDGELFCISYDLIVNIKRPWYTFDVMQHTPIAIQNVASAPAGDEVGELGNKVLATGTEAAVEKEIAIKDYKYPCGLKYDRVTYNIGDTLKGEFHFKTDKQDPITEASILLYKIEKADGEENEVILKEQIIEHENIIGSENVDVDVEETEGEQEEPTEGEEAPEPSPAENEAEGVPGDLDVVEGNVKFDFVIDGENYTLSPSMAEAIEGDHFVSVRHFIRIVVKDADGRKYWNTNEVIIYRNVVAGEKGAAVASV